MWHTVPEQELNISQKMTTKETWTFYLRQLLLFIRLSYYFVPCVRLTKSSTLVSAPFRPALRASFMENITDIFFLIWALLKGCGGYSKSIRVLVEN